MATSESDADFESADEELGRGAPVKRDTRVTACRTTVDSESDDDTEFVGSVGTIWQRSFEPDEPLRTMSGRKALAANKADKIDDVKVESAGRAKSAGRVKKTSKEGETTSPDHVESASAAHALSTTAQSTKDAQSGIESSVASEAMSKVEATKSGEKQVSQTSKSRQDTSRHVGVKKLGTRLAKDNAESCAPVAVAAQQEDECSVKCSNEKLSVNKDTEERSKTQVAGNLFRPSSALSEVDMPEELKSNKKFKEVFQPEGWEGLGDDVVLPDELMEENLQPVLQRLSLATKAESKDEEDSLASWGSWGNWGVTSLINTATASVSTLTSHVSQGLTLLEGTMGAQDPAELERIKQGAVTETDGTIFNINSVLL